MHRVESCAFDLLKGREKEVFGAGEGILSCCVLHGSHNSHTQKKPALTMDIPYFQEQAKRGYMQSQGSSVVVFKE